jgi:hypothetical protein
MEIDMTKKHVLAGVAAGALMIGATSVSAAPMTSDAAGIRPASVTHVKYKKHQARHHAMRHATRMHAWNGGPVETWNNGPRWRQSRWSQLGPFGLPFAAAEGAVGLGAAAVGAGLGTAGAIVGGTTAAVTGYPYATGYPYGAYGSYGYAPDAYSINSGGAYTVQGPVVNGGPAYGYAPTNGYRYPY